MSLSKPYSKAVLYTHKKQRRYSGGNALQISLPMGGIGSGCIGLNGEGGLQDFSIRNMPATTAVPDGHNASDSAFATLYLPGSETTLLVEGPMPAARIYNQGLKGQGYRSSGHEGLPRFRKAEFQGEYPFGYVSLSDPDLPLQVKITGFNPFIPLDDKNSSIPCAIMEYSFTNISGQAVPFEFSFHLSHCAYGSGNTYNKTRNAVVPGTGVYLYNEEDPNATTYGSCALGVAGFTPQIKAMWFRGGWFDSLSFLWKEISTGTFSVNDGSGTAESTGRNGGSILVKHTLGAGETVTIPVILAWYFPNVDYSYGEYRGEGDADAWSFAEQGTAACGDDCDCHKIAPPRWHPYYATQWKDAKDVLVYVRDQYQNLRQRTQAFHDALFDSSFPDYVLDAVSSNLGIIKSPTILRQANGNVWAWEGCFCTSGCCHGSCTHVWNYAQSIPHLFPQLERTLREQELVRSIDKEGHISFRSALPDGPTNHNFHAASDGQLGGIMKAYREWWISGDSEWLTSLYPALKKSMDYCIQCWDPDHLGVLVEPHHNTYDIEFWGPDGMCTGFYLGALAAMAAITRQVGKPEDALFYEELGHKGAQYLDEHLFNGEYYEQNVTLRGLRASPSEESLQKLQASNPAEYALLMEEGPKYQYGKGCISDGVFGAWLARQCGLESYQSRQGIRQNLKAIFNNNFKPDLWRHANTQRPGYALGDEPGLLLCTWPKGGKPTLPFVYSDEVWTGIEYQSAAHMISEGLVDEGLTIVKALRSRYDGLTRNPWNEYECGNYYARAMASYGLLIALTGFRYSAPDKTLFLEPQWAARPLKFFFSTATGWGTLTLREKTLKVDVIEGVLDVDQLVLSEKGETITLPVGMQIRGSKIISLPTR